MRPVPAPAPDLTSLVHDRFREVFGAPPDGVWRAPGRVNLIGEHVDYQGGLCLPVALAHGTFAAVRARTDDRVGLVSLQRAEEDWSGSLGDVAPGTPPGWAAYLAGVLWALCEEGVAVPGVDVLVASTVPLGAGLSSSASLECSLAIAVADLLDLPTDDAGRAVLAAACVRAENDVVGASTGGLDQAVSLRAHAGHALLFDALDGSTAPVPLPVREHGLALRVYDTRASHRLVDSEYAARRTACARAADLLGVPTLRQLPDRDTALERLAALEDGDALIPLVRHVVDEIARVRAVVDLLEAGDPTAVGPLLDASHRSLQVDYAVSSPELDVAVGAARQAGALGARMTGGGFGGSILALLPGADVDRVDTQVLAAFTERDWPLPTPLEVLPGPAAHRTR